MQTEPRTFLVHVEDDRRHCRTFEGASFEEAAMAFAEEFHSDDDELRVIVIDPADGRRQCFRVDVGAHGAEPCA